ncbi:type II secretion system protein GspC [Escherichia coli]
MKDKDITLKILTPKKFMFLVLFMIIYKMVIIIRQVWLYDGQPTVNFSPVTAIQETSTSDKAEDKIQFNLFGTASQPTMDVGQDTLSSLQNTAFRTLDLKVAGIITSSKSENSIAIITKDNQQFSLGIGEKIPGASATVEAIFVDHIVINNQGKNESFFLDFDKQTKNIERNCKRLTSGYAITSKLYKLQNFYNLVSMTPVIVNKKLNGYRLTPGKDSQSFYHVGLQDNDLAVSLNGSDLRDTKQAQQIMEQLPDITEIKITVERDGQLHDIFIAVGGW